MVESWTESMTARERVKTIATTLSEPRTANWIAEQADVKWDTAKKHLDDLADSGILLVTEDGTYVPDPARAYFDRLRELILTKDRDTLRAELEAIGIIEFEGGGSGRPKKLTLAYDGLEIDIPFAGADEHAGTTAP